MKKACLLLLAFLAAITFSCDSTGSKTSVAKASLNLKEAPRPNKDSLYAFVEQQVEFGPRVPNTEAHEQAANWFVNKFEGYGGKVTVQAFKDRVYDGTEVQLKNIIASFNPSAKKRILLAAHWDTRPFGDKDPNNDMIKIDGANDGGSGVAVLLEIARIMSGDNPPAVGVDMILFDGEDWGQHENMSDVANPRDYGKESWYCLGSQYWSKNKHNPNYTAYYGILLDMVGAQGSTFYYDGVSQQNAGRVLSRPWDIAHELGYSNLFVKEMGMGLIIDDHKFVNEHARIPMIDIIDYRKNVNDFGPYHHTQEDNLSVISKDVLGAVAHVVLTVLYNE